MFGSILAVLAVIVLIITADYLGMTDAATGEPEGSDGRTLDGLRAVLSSGGGGGQRQEHLNTGGERFSEAEGETGRLPDKKISGHILTSCHSPPCQGREGRGRGTCPPPPSA